MLKKNYLRMTNNDKNNMNLIYIFFFVEKNTKNMENYIRV